MSDQREPKKARRSSKKRKQSKDPDRAPSKEKKQKGRGRDKSNDLGEKSKVSARSRDEPSNRDTSRQKSSRRGDKSSREQSTSKQESDRGIELSDIRYRNKKDLDESRPSQAVLPSEASIESPSEEEYEVEEGERIQKARQETLQDKNQERRRSRKMNRDDRDDDDKDVNSSYLDKNISYDRRSSRQQQRGRGQEQQHIRPELQLVEPGHSSSMMTQQQMAFHQEQQEDRQNQLGNQSIGPEEMHDGYQHHNQYQYNTGQSPLGQDNHVNVDPELVEHGQVDQPEQFLVSPLEIEEIFPEANFDEDDDVRMWWLCVYPKHEKKRDPNEWCHDLRRKKIRKCCKLNFIVDHKWINPNVNAHQWDAPFEKYKADKKKKDEEEAANKEAKDKKADDPSSGQNARTLNTAEANNNGSSSSNQRSSGTGPIVERDSAGSSGQDPASVKDAEDPAQSNDASETSDSDKQDEKKENCVIAAYNKFEQALQSSCFNMVYFVCNLLYTIIVILIMVSGIYAMLQTQLAIKSKELLSLEQMSIRVIRDTIDTALDKHVYTDVQMIDPMISGKKCSDGWEPILTVFWPGTEKSCQAYGSLLTFAEAERSFAKYPCELIGPAYDSVVQQLYPEAIICGKVLTREYGVANGSTTCPMKDLCNPRSRDKNHWAKCPIKTGNAAKECPIVGLKILNKQVADIVKNKPNFPWDLREFYQSGPVSDVFRFNLNLAITRTESDENPLTDIRAADVMPCVDPTKVDHKELFFTNYPMEQYQRCDQIDTRFTEQEDIGSDEFKVQQNSGVMDKMTNNLVRYEKYVSNPRKEYITYNAYTRAAPNLNCQTSLLERIQEATDVYTVERVAQTQEDLGWASARTLITLVIICFAICVQNCSSYQCKDRCIMTFFPFIWFFSALILTIQLFEKAQNLESLVLENEKLMDVIFGNSQCGDAISSKYAKQMSGELQGITKKAQNGAQLMQVFSFLGLLLMSVGLALTILAYFRNTTSVQQAQREKSQALKERQEFIYWHRLRPIIDKRLKKEDVLETEWKRIENIEKKKEKDAKEKEDAEKEAKDAEKKEKKEAEKARKERKEGRKREREQS